MITVRIEGIEQLEKKLNQISSDLKDTGKPMKKSEKWLMRDIDTNWRREGGLFGGWKPLAASTRRQRVSMGFPGARPILNRTGKLKRGTKSKVGKNKVVIENDVDYFKYHQLGTRKMPQRKILELRKEGVEAVKKIFKDWVGDIVKK